MLEPLERFVEAITHVEVEPEQLIELLSTDPAGILAGGSVPSREFFPAEVTVELGAGTSLAQAVDVTFGRLSPAAGVGRFGLSWRAVKHAARFPVFGGDLEVHPEGTGAVLRLAGYYLPPLGLVGAFGDSVLGHRVARRALQAFLEAAAARAEAALVLTEPHHEATPVSGGEAPGTEVYLG